MSSRILLGLSSQLTYISKYTEGSTTLLIPCFCPSGFKRVTDIILKQLTVAKKATELNNFIIFIRKFSA
jgi:hypothetical protein